jgi:hypothetical protein
VLVRAGQIEQSNTLWGHFELLILIRNKTFEPEFYRGALPRCNFTFLEGWFDMRDLGAVLDNEEPLPIRPCDLVQ